MPANFDYFMNYFFILGCFSESHSRDETITIAIPIIIKNIPSDMTDT